jgi:hypothetical protein
MSEPTPHDLELLRSFDNTAYPDTGTDQLDSSERLHEWLVARSLLALDATIDEKAHRATLELREAFRALALANGVRELDPAATTTPNRLGAEASLSVLMGPDGHAELHAVGEGLHQTFGHLFSIVYTATVDGNFQQRVCERHRPVALLSTSRRRGRRGGAKCKSAPAPSTPPPIAKSPPPAPAPSSQQKPWRRHDLAQRTAATRGCTPGLPGEPPHTRYRRRHEPSRYEGVSYDRSGT